jgi:hypothetical protein
VITAAAGDFGYLNWTEAEEAKARGANYYAGIEYPAASPHVIAVGGTKLTLNAAGARQSETVWNEDPSLTGKNEGAGGGGCSLKFKAQTWQSQVPDWSSVGCGTGSESRRAIADVSADGDPYTGVAIYDGEPDGAGSWRTFGGTSISSPIIASMFALAGGAHGVSYPAQTLYSHLGSPSLYDVIAGGDGMCNGTYSGACTGSMSPLSPVDCGADSLICNAAPGYDGPTGVGTPNGVSAFKPGAEEGRGDAKENPTESQGSDTGATSTPATGASISIPRRVTKRPSRHHPAVIRLSNLVLTFSAVEALRHGRTAITRLAFAFTLSASAVVRVGLSKLVGRNVHQHWQVLPDALTIAAVRGHNRAHLEAPGSLSPGLYRLRLRPVGASPRSLLITVGS